MPKRALVTGGAGFIGSHVVDSLLADGARVIVVDDLSAGIAERVAPEAALETLSIVDADRLNATVDALKPDAIFHLAAQASVIVSTQNPGYDCAVNVTGTLNVLEASRRHGAPVVFTSTGGALYGDDAPIPTDESRIPAPLSPYGASKWAAEVYVNTWAAAHGIRHAICRLGNVYGPRQNPHGEAGVVAIFAGRVLDGRPARIFGDGMQTRDYVYVGDVVASMIAAADAAASGADHDLRDDGLRIPTYNVGTGIATSVLDLWDAMERAGGTDNGREFEPRREGEIQNSVLDASFARTRLGVGFDTPFEEGLRATIDWLGGRVGA